MCLAVPGQVVSVYLTDGARMGKVRFGSILKEVCLEFVPEIEVGDYTIVHVGFALSKIDEETALQSLALFDSLGELDEQGEILADENPGGATNGGQTRSGREGFGR
jgi:hydrogenase expression/formation protein HypC